MKITPEELAAKRARADHLRAEIRSLAADDVATRREREMAVESVALDEEIAALEIKVVDAAKASGGTVDDARAAMQRAADIEKMMTPEKEDSEDSESKEDSDEEDDDKSDETKEEPEEVPAEVPAEPAFGPGIVRPNFSENKEEGSR